MRFTFPTKQKEILEDARNQRIAILLSEVWHAGSISRSRLGKITGLALPSVTRLIQDLRNANVITEAEKGKSTGGRQPQLVKLNPDAGLVIALDLSGVELRGAILDITLQIQHVIRQPYQGRQPQAIEEQLIRLCSRLLEEAKSTGKKVLGIGISTPGIVDTHRGVLLDSNNPRLVDFPLSDILHQAFNIPVYLEHDTSAAALAEMCIGAGYSIRNLVYITVSTGIGAGLVIDNQIYRGASNLAGELGHVIIDRGGQICTCGNRGCLEAIAAVPSMISNLQNVLLRQTDAKSLTEVVTLERLIQRAADGDHVTLEIISQAADYLAMALSMMASIIDIRLMIVGGDVIQMGDHYFTPLRTALQKYQPEGPPIQVVPASLGENTGLIGASMVALQNCLV